MTSTTIYYPSLPFLKNCIAFKIDITFKISRCELWDYLTGVEVSGTGVLLEHKWKGGGQLQLSHQSSC